MSNHTGFACGKIILSGEYAVVFGYPGIAIPAPIGIRVTKSNKVEWDNAPKEWLLYLHKIIDICIANGAKSSGVTIENHLPLGKGMGSSTALIIAVVRCLMCRASTTINAAHLRETALSIENSLNNGHSGLDFEVIWNEKPIKFLNGKSKPINLPTNILKDAVLIDTGAPKESTPELVKSVRSQVADSKISSALQTIGHCTEQILKEDDIKKVFRTHHRAQIALGVVPQKVRECIQEIESSGGYAKVIGAGGRTGGSGIVLAFGNNISTISSSYGYRNFRAQHRVHQVLGK